MEFENLYQENVHHGHNIRRIRKSRGMKQEDLASQVGMTQQNLSKIELRSTVEDDMLTRFAKVLKVPIEDLKYMEEESPKVIIENNTFENSGNSSSNLGNSYSGNDYPTGGNTINSESNEAIKELYEEKLALYVKLLKEEKEKNESLEKRLSILEEKLTGK